MAEPSFQARIVPFSPNDYSAFTSLWNEAYPELKRAELEMRLFDMSLGPQSSPRRWLAEHDGLVIGFTGFEHLEGHEFHPHKYQLHLYVAPRFRCSGIGSGLYNQALARLRSDNALIVRVWVREDRREGLSFLTSRGFVEEMRTFHSALDTTTFDLSRLERYLRRLERYGYEFRTFGNLAADPNRNRKAYDLYGEVLVDIPSPGPRQLLSFDEFEQKIVKNPELFYAYFLALHQDRYVGLCSLLPHGRNRDELYADTLGIQRSYRGRGIAQALSYRGIEYAQTHGYSLISADSFVENYRISALLENLGFGNKTVWTLFSKLLRTETDA